MRMTRCHLDVPLSAGDLVRLPENISSYLVRVMRLGAGDHFVLFNGDGFDYTAKLDTVHPKAAEAQVISARAVHTESPLRLVIAQSVARGEKMDFVLQKATELGAYGFVPLSTERSEVKLDDKRADKRMQHWRGVISSACEQSGRARVPELARVHSLADFLGHRSDTPARDLPLFYLDPDADLSLRQLPATTLEGACFVIGPEGGLGTRDLTLLQDRAATGLRLGPRILRTETAALTLLAAMQAMHGDF